MDTNGHTILFEDYVSFEIAKLLKEKGFDSNMYTCYTDCEFPEFLTMIDYVVQGEEYERSNFESHNLIQAPTHQMTLKWLREVHNIHVEIRYMPDNFTDEPCYKAMIWDMNTEIGTPLSPNISYTYFETCVEAAIKYTLENLI